MRKRFDSLSHQVVLDSVTRVIKDHEALTLCATIVRASGKDGVGLPIGNLTSQWFCNLVLDRLDHHVKEVLRILGYARYMDDFVLLANDKARLRAALRDVESFLLNTLHLTLKDHATLLAPAGQGLPFLGWRSIAVWCACGPRTGGARGSDGSIGNGNIAWD